MQWRLARPRRRGGAHPTGGGDDPRGELAQRTGGRPFRHHRVRPLRGARQSRLDGRAALFEADRHLSPHRAVEEPPQTVGAIIESETSCTGISSVPSTTYPVSLASVSAFSDMSPGLWRRCTSRQAVNISCRQRACHLSTSGDHIGKRPQRRPVAGQVDQPIDASRVPLSDSSGDVAPKVDDLVGAESPKGLLVVGQTGGDHGCPSGVSANWIA